MVVELPCKVLATIRSNLGFSALPKDTSDRWTPGLSRKLCDKWTCCTN